MWSKANSIWIQHCCKVMLYHLVKDSHVLNTFSAFQDSLTLKMKALKSFAMLWTTHLPNSVNTQDQYPQQHCCVKLKSQKLLYRAISWIWWFSYFSSTAYFVKYTHKTVKDFSLWNQDVSAIKSPHMMNHVHTDIMSNVTQAGCITQCTSHKWRSRTLQLYPTRTNCLRKSSQYTLLNTDILWLHCSIFWWLLLAMWHEQCRQE
jgi:hypothetical protein